MRGAWLRPALVVAVCGAAATAQAVPESVPSATRDESARPLPNGKELVRSMVDRQRSFEKAIDDYTYDVVTTEAKLDDEDRVRESHARRSQPFVAGRVPLLKRLRQRVTEEFSNHRRFVVSTEETVVGPRQ